MRKTSALLVLGLVAAVTAQSVQAQVHPLSGLRIADETGAARGQLPAPPGEKHFYLDAGTQSFHIAFDFSGEEATDVQLRLLGPMGTIVFQQTESYTEAGTQVVAFDNGMPLEDNEYVVNAYIGPEWYLADSLQLALGAAQIPESQFETGDGTDGAAQATLVPLTPQPAASPGPVPGGPSNTMLVLALLGVLVLGAIVVWAAMSAMRPRR